MYTQCPECDVAFRVTAEILRQAAGKVRCGSCGTAFNALEYLSEEKPAPQARPEPEPDLPELTPDAPADVDTEAGDSISAEQSAALLKTLDELAGEDIRIEDTGVEWRVIGPDDDADETGASGDDPVLPEQDAEEPGRTEARQMRFDDDTPLPDDFDAESEPIAPPEAGPREPAADSPPDFSQVDLELGEPDEWEDLLGEFGDDGIEPGDGTIVPEEAWSADSPDSGIDAAPGIPAEGGEPEPREFLAEEPDRDERAIDELDDDGPYFFETGGDEPEADEVEPDELGTNELRADDHEAFDRAGDTPETGQPGTGEAGAADDFGDFPVEIPEHELQAESVELADDLPRDESPTMIETELAAQDEADGPEAEDVESQQAEPDSDWRAPEHPDIPELTEEEKTINMLIDQDLLAIAVEDEDGFSSTIVQRQPDREDDGDTNDAGTDAPARSARDQTPLFETIVMAAEEPESERGVDAHDAGVGAGASPQDGPAPGTRRPAMAAGVILLVLALAIQFVHYSRETLATVPAINNAVAPLYRAIGRPVSPGWDVSGWRFEATKGSTDEAGERLTIYSRIGNTSDADLPLPVVHVALTDRFEETIGSRVLEPAQYLVGDADPRQAIPPGQTFDAVITIENPSSEATGFQLNVCYRLASGRLRCAIEDFR